MIVSLILWATALVAIDEGQGVGAPDARVEELHLGEYWFGAEVSHEDLIGKVVLVELWGS